MENKNVCKFVSPSAIKDFTVINRGVSGNKISVDPLPQITQGSWNWNNKSIIRIFKEKPVALIRKG